MSLKPSANGRQKSLNKCETQNKFVFHICLRRAETINIVSLKCFANQTNRCPACIASRSDLLIAG